MFYEPWNGKKIWKHIIGQKNCIDSQNELTIFVKRQNLIYIFKQFLQMLLKTLFQTRFKILHCYHISNNPLTHIKVSLSLSLNISIYELRAHNIDAILEILATTCSCVFNEHKQFNRCHMPLSINLNVLWNWEP